MTPSVGIEALDVQGVKGLTGRVELGGLVLFHGDPGSGKTRVLWAVQFAVLGYVPALGKKPATVGRIMSGDVLRVRVELTDGRTFSRTVRRTTSGSGPTARASYTTDAEASWVKGSASQVGEAIRKLVGETDEEAAECMDVGELLKASPQGRAQRIETLLSASSADPLANRARASALTLSSLTGGDAERVPADRVEAEDAARGMLAQLGEGERAIVRPILGDLARRVSDLPEAIKWANEGKRRAREGVTHKQAAYQELEDQARQLEAPAVTLTAIDDEAGKLVVEQARIDGRAEQATKHAAALVTATAAVQRAEVALAEAEGRQGGATGDPDALARVAQEYDAQADLIEVPPPIPEPERPPRPVGSPAGEAARRALRALVAPATPDLPSATSLRGARDAALRRVEDITADPWSEVRRIVAELAEWEDGGAGSALYARLLTLADRHGAGDPGEAAEALAKAERALVAGGEAWARYEDARRAYEAKRQSLTGEADAADRGAQEAWLQEVGRINGAHAEARLARQGERMAAEAERDQLRADARKAREKAAAIRREASALVDAIARLRREASEARGRLDGLRTGAGVPTVAELDADTARRAAIVDRLEILAHEREAVEGANVLRRSVQQRADELALAQVEANAYAAAERALQRLRAEEVGDRAAPLTSVMATFLEAAGIPFRPYLEASPQACDFGWVRDGERHPIEAMSGGETALFGAALAAAIIALRGRELRILMVESGELGHVVPALFRGLEAVADKLGTVIVATCYRVDPPMFWTAHDTGQGTVRE